MIQSLMDLRHEGDYQDFAEITEEEAEGEEREAIISLISLKIVSHGKEVDH